MFDNSPKIHLVPSKTLELVRLQLKLAHNVKDPEIILVICNFADSLLVPLKSVIRRPSRFTFSSCTIHNVDIEQETLLCQEIASAYLDHASLMADLGHADMAQNSRKRADKWGGPGDKKVTSLLPKEESRALDAAAVPESIFPDDICPPVLLWSFPEPDGRVADTPQLVSCLGLLNQGSKGLTEDALEPAARKWLQETERSEDEKARLKNLATDLIRTFTRDEIQDKKAITEVLFLAPVLGEDDFRFLLRQFFQTIEGSPILDIGALKGLAQLLQSASSPAHLHAQDLIDILGLISTRLQETHEQSRDHIFELTVAVSSVLDAMADTKVSGLKRERLHEPLLTFLGGLQSSSDLHLKYYASYAFQALLCVPDDESPWQATVRRTTKVVKGISGLVSAVKGLDLSGFLAGLQSIQEGFEGVEQVIKLTKTAYEGVSAVYEGEQDLLASLKDGLTFSHKRAWYSALRGADALIDGGELAKFRILVCEAVCRRELAFQWGICQRLAYLAVNPLWGIKTRQGAVRFLEEIYRGDIVWGQLPPIKTYILDILKQLSMMDTDLQAALLLKDLATDGDAAKQDIYRNCTLADLSAHLLKSRVPELASPSLLDRVQRRTDVEADLRRIKKFRINERGGTVYVPPLAKADLRVSDETFPLMSKVDGFLVDKDKVLLLLGDSGAGKTTFNRQLDLKLWNEYKPKTGRIPLLISLPAIDRPDQDLIAKHLRICEFSEPQIRELKDREFIIICDGYDESQQTQNLYESNRLNTDGGWKAQMVISCRSEHLGQDYRDVFQPQKSNPSDPLLFQQAVLVPFSMEQVQEYIAQYVSIKRPLWVASDYEGVLDQIPSLQDLVKNPFLLTLSLEVLPRIADPGQKLESNKITRVLLYDEFVVQWLERNKKRLFVQDLSDPERRALESLSDDGFTQQGLLYLKNLSAAIYKEQGGNPVVEYSRARDSSTWKEQFFGRSDEETQLLRTAIPMTRNGGRFGFIHRSILEYGVSRAIYEPQNRMGLKLAAAGAAGTDNKRRKSVDSAFSFEMDEAADETTINLTIQGPNPDSLLAKKSFIKDTSVLQFLVERVDQEPVFKGQLLDYIESSKVDKKWRTAAANAITILVRAGVRFNGSDLKGIQIPRADLSGGQFDSAQLEWADLRKTNLRNTWMRQADFSKAQMAGVQFGEWPYLQESSEVLCCSYSPNGKTCVFGLGDGTISVYDTMTWTKTHTLQGHTHCVWSVAYSPSGHQIASGNSDNTVRLWDTQTGAPGPVLSGHTSNVSSVAYSPSGHQVASGSSDMTVRLWDTQTGAPGPVLSGHIDSVWSVAYSPSGHQIASGSWDKTVRLWDTQTGAPGPVLSGHIDSVLSVAYSPSGHQIASGSSDMTVRLWDMQTGAPGPVLSGHTSNVSSVAYSPSGHQITSDSSDMTVRLWDTQTGAPGPVLSGHTSNVSSVAYSPSGHQVASGSEDNTVRLWDTQTGAPGPVLSGHIGSVWSVAYSPSGHQIASGNSDNTVRLWDTQTGAPGPVLSGHIGSVRSVAYSPSGHQVASGSSDMTVRLWDTQTGAPGPVLSGHIGSVWSVAYSPSGHQIASGNSDNTVRLWDTQTGAPGPVLSGHIGSVRSVAYSPSGHQVASGSSDMTVRLWDTQTGAPGPVLSGHIDSVWSVAYSPSGHQIASGSWDKTVRLWDTQTGAPGPVLSGHIDSVLSVAYSPSGHQIASGSEDKTVRLWDANSGRCLVVVKDFHGPINTIAWNATPDGTYLVTGCGDTSVRLWQLTEEEGIFQLLLQWSSAHVRLAMSGASMEDVRGLSRVNMRLLQQSGAVGDPKPVITLQIAGSTMSTVVSAASKFKQLRNSKMITGSSTVNSPVQQLDV